MNEVPAAPAAETPKPGEVPQPTPAPAETVPTPEPQPEKTFTQAQLDEIVERRLAKERRKREDLDRRLKVTEELVLKRSAAEKTPEQPAKPQGEPVRGEFGTYEEYLEARAEYRANSTVDKKMKEREDADRTARAKQDQETQREQFRKAMKDSAKDIEDFDDVVGGIKADDPVASVSATAIEAADKPGRVLYHLAQHPDVAERIAGLPVGKQAREIVELEKTLSKPAVKPSKAPDPIKPVGGGKTANADEMPDAAKEPEKWLKWRQRQLAERKRTGVAA